MDSLLEAPDPNDPIELRDKAMLELLYATGLRVTELVSLTMENISLRQGVVRVIGKGGKERLVPMGENAVDWIETFIEQGRPQLLGDNSSDVVFPSKRAKQMTRQTFWYRIKHYSVDSGYRYGIIVATRIKACFCNAFTELWRRSQGRTDVAWA